MSDIGQLLHDLRNLQVRQSQHQEDRQGFGAQIRKIIEDLRELIIAGGTTGDPLFDAVIVNHFTINDVYVERLRQIERDIAAHPGELIMLVERDVRISVHRGPQSPSRPSDYGAVEQRTIGELNGSSLIIERPSEKPHNEEADTISAMMNSKPWRVGFPTSGYIIEPKVDPAPVITPGNIFPHNDLLMTYLQPLRPGLDDDWMSDLGNPTLPFFQRGGPTGNKLDVYIGDEKILQQMAKQLIISPLFLFWVRRAFGHDPVSTPEVEQALVKLAEEYQQKLAKHLDELTVRKSQLKIPDLEKTIRETLAKMASLDIALSDILQAQLDQHHLPPPK